MSSNKWLNVNSGSPAIFPPTGGLQTSLVHEHGNVRQCHTHGTYGRQITRNPTYMSMVRSAKLSGDIGGCQSVTSGQKTKHHVANYLVDVMLRLSNGMQLFTQIAKSLHV